jgi:hypothetical protein
MWRVFCGFSTDAQRRPKAGQANSEVTSAIAFANSALRGRTGNFGCGWEGKMPQAFHGFPGFLKVVYWCLLWKPHAINIPFGMFAFLPAPKMVMTWDGHRWFGTNMARFAWLHDFTHQLTSQSESIEVWRGLYETIIFRFADCSQELFSNVSRSSFLSQ